MYRVRLNRKNAMGVRGQFSGLPPPIIDDDTISFSDQSSGVAAVGWSSVHRAPRTQPTARPIAPYRIHRTHGYCLSLIPKSMGCTSSAPNMVTPKSNTAEKSIQFEGDINVGDSNDVDDIIYRTEDKKKVLPSCDTLKERVHVVRNISTASLLSEKDHGNSHLRDNKIDTTTAQQDDKIPKLEEVVEKVVELYNTDIFDETHSMVPKNEGDQTNEENIENDKVEDPSIKEITVDTGNESNGEQRVEHPAEASPSQSDSSRATATRWEALADIAAELPPSLAVDPITGQIYTLSK